MQSNANPTLVLIRGLPGSGKSFIAEALLKKLGTNKAISLDPDMVNQNSAEYKAHVESQITEGVEPALHLYRFVRAQAYMGIEQHKIIIWNQPFSNSETLKKVLDRLQEYAATKKTTLEILIVEVNIDPSVAKARILERKTKGGHGPSDSVFTRFINEYESWATSEYSVVQVNGTDDVQISVDLIISKLN